MSVYQPTARRPIAGLFRRTADLAVRWCVRLSIHPNWVSYSSVVAAGLAALCFLYAGAEPLLLLPAAAFLYLRLWLNMLDGMVALASGKASRTGEIVNELPDRVSDVVIFVGVAHSGLCHVLLGYWAALFALLVAYVGTLGQAVGAKREFGGIMSKPWRMVVLHLGAWAALAVGWWTDGETSCAGWSVLDGTLLLISAGCVQTIVVRLVHTVRLLQG